MPAAAAASKPTRTRANLNNFARRIVQQIANCLRLALFLNTVQKHFFFSFLISHHDKRGGLPGGVRTADYGEYYFRVLAFWWDSGTPFVVKIVPSIVPR